MTRHKSRRVRPGQQTFSRGPRSAPQPRPVANSGNADLIQFALQSGRFDQEIERAKRTFWRQSVPEIHSREQVDVSMIFWADWFIYKRPTGSGLTPLQTFIQEYHEHLSAEDLAAYQRQLQSVISVFEVVEVVHDRSVIVRDLQNDQMYTVIEKRATRQMAPGHLISAHILPLPDGYRFTAALAPWPPALKEHVADFLAGLAAEGKGSETVGFIPALEQARCSAYMERTNMRRLERAIQLYRGGRADWPEARRLLKKLLETEPFNPALNFYYGLVCEDMAEREHRLLVVQAILPEFPDPWGQRLDFHLAFAFEAQKKYDKAEAAYHRLLRQDPDNSATYYNFGTMLERMGRWEEAEALYRQAAGRFRDDHHCHAVLGYLYLNRDRRDEARKEFELAWQKARRQLVDFPGCIDDSIMDELEVALRKAGGDPTTLPEPKPRRRFWR